MFVAWMMAAIVLSMSVMTPSVIMGGSYTQTVHPTRVRPWSGSPRKMVGPLKRIFGSELT